MMRPSPSLLGQNRLVTGEYRLVPQQPLRQGRKYGALRDTQPRRIRFIAATCLGQLAFRTSLC